ncbi:polysaccharide pyruvyl transferase family protein [Aestuariibaculum sediminum]|uniref:Polysaccharide pyruvyl transferase family protein n=1 Tax=Aestuariibaculum sediminum TaxID=2770637 RepID=A0A8J6Q5X4_9FLAO|nr:polysaccharide pyruvyl transferase family protein [Aestuariibaculum sediminum]MBD0831213.1 polysaccharide pyruvyl transferase family protein [Aestuariibaculum sediminum]
MKKLKIGILTLPLHSNYGGLLQAYALLFVLKEMGHDAWLINYRNKKSKVRLVLSYLKRYILKYFLKKDVKISPFKEEEFIRSNTQRFINEHIQPQTKAFYTPKALSSKIISYNFDAFIVGSDQVWRPQYVTKIEDYFFGFVKDKQLKRMSYAASFGSNDWNYSEEQTEKCKRYIQLFNAVSVRENSGLELCKEHFKVNATHVLDPTMLLDVKDYLNLVNINKSTYKPKGGILIYILDETPDIKITIDSISSTLNLSTFKVNNNKTYDKKASLKDRVAPPVEDWVIGFYDADFVIADSFHACLYSIIFNKPFVIYGNARRGMTRFTSILSKLDLEDRLIYSSEELRQEELNNNIDWNSVNKKLEKLKADSFAFLRDNL